MTVNTTIRWPMTAAPTDIFAFDFSFKEIIKRQLSSALFVCYILAQGLNPGLPDNSPEQYLHFATLSTSRELEITKIYTHITIRGRKNTLKNCLIDSAV